MAATALKARACAWATQYKTYLTLTQQLATAQPQECDALERAIAAAQDDLLDTSAPTLTAVVQKLEILFEGEMHGLDQGSEEKRLILEDLTSLILAQSQLLGAQLPA